MHRGRMHPEHRLPSLCAKQACSLFNFSPESIRGWAHRQACLCSRKAFALYEVLLGLLSRQFRLFTALAHDPHLWTPDLGNALRRMLTDGLILAAWLARRNDPTLFRRYKDYSIGKQKLLKLHVEAAADEHGADAEDVIEALQESLDEEMWEEFVTIDVGAPFERVKLTL